MSSELNKYCPFCKLYLFGDLATLNCDYHPFLGTINLKSYPLQKYANLKYKLFFKSLINLLLFLSVEICNAQLIIASKEVVCPGETFELKVNENALKTFDFCVEPMGQRYGFYYFKTCKQVSVFDAIIMAKMMRGHLATANDDAKNDYLFRLMPNDIHWIGFHQNPKAKFFNDPPDPASGWEFMSKEPFSRAYWVAGEPNNDEQNNPGMHTIQGCRRDPLWCDESGDKKYVGLIESVFNVIPPPIIPTILWETGETTQSINASTQTSKYFKVKIDYGVYAIQDSILIEIPTIEDAFSKPGGCNPYKWKPELKSNVPLNTLEIKWSLGDTEILNQFKPEFIKNTDGFIDGKVEVSSKECGIALFSKTETFELYPMTSQAPVDSIIKLNDIIRITPINEGPYIYNWKPSSGLNETQIREPEFKASKDIGYTVEISDDFGCKVTETFNFEIDKNLNIIVPNVFTPNMDKHNELFEIRTVDGFYGNILNVRFYNNIGQMIYECLPGEWGWDGTINKRPAQAGQYIFVITYQIGNKNYTKTEKLLIIR